MLWWAASKPRPPAALALWAAASRTKRLEEMKSIRTGLYTSSSSSLSFVLLIFTCLLRDFRPSEQLHHLKWHNLLRFTVISLILKASRSVWWFADLEKKEWSLSYSLSSPWNSLLALCTATLVQSPVRCARSFECRNQLRQVEEWSWTGDRFKTLRSH